MLLQVEKHKLKLIDQDYIEQFSRVKKPDHHQRKKHHDSTSSLNLYESNELTIAKSTLSEKSSSFTLLKDAAHRMDALPGATTKSVEHLNKNGGEQEDADSIFERSSVRSDRTEYLDTEFLSQSNLALEQIAAAMENKPKRKLCFNYFFTCVFVGVVMFYKKEKMETQTKKEVKINKQGEPLSIIFVKKII
jgi:hypothetical protein